MDINQLRSELENGTKRSFYIFTGDEKRGIEKFIQRIDQNAITLDSFQQLWTKLTNKGLFKTKETYVLYNSEEAAEVSIKKLLSQIGSNRVILVYDSVDMRKKFFKEGKPYITEFKKLSDSQLMQYVMNKIDVSKQLAFVIVKYCNNEYSRIELELNKLQHLEGEITLDIVNELITPPAEDRIFDMIDCVAKRDREGAFSIYYDLIELKESPIKIISLLYSKFKQLFLVQTYFKFDTNTIMEKTGLNYGQVQYTRNVVGSFTNRELLNILKDIQQAEVGVKTGKIEMFRGTEDLLLKIMK